ncbi:AsmA family protein [Nitrosomonas sp. Nm51]|uniref:AsmA family protein n=1 Tax=Nitrosomonas sp. Nm51 TaxID=133720 RepID=UPI0008BBE865|nr:AsmA family protein [Nitrosomonas sp. Nm51]SER56403.1 AsmA family protein [Nitrosomonas sp. Nm51]
MRCILRYVLVFLMVTVCLAAVLILAALVEPGVFKSQIEQWVKANKQRVLTIGGDVQINYAYPWIEIQVSDVTLSEFQQDTPFAAVEQARLSLSLWPLLRQRIKVNNITIKGLRARLIRGQNGRMNIEDLLSQSEESLPFAVEITRTRTTDGSIFFHDEITRRQIEFNQLNLMTGRITAEYAETIVLRSPLVEVRLPVFENNDANANKHMSRILTMQLMVEQLKFNETGMRGGPVALSLQHIATGSHLNARLSKLDIIQSAPAGGSLARARLVMELVARQEKRTVQIALDTALAVEQDGRQWEFGHFKTEFAAFDPEFVRDPVQGRFDGNLNLDISAELLQTELQGELAESRVEVVASLRDFANPDITVKVEVGALDLDALVPMGKFKAEQSEASSNGPLANTVTLPDFSFLNNLNLSGSITIGLLSAGGARLSGVQFVMKPEDQDHFILKKSGH